MCDGIIAVVTKGARLVRKYKRVQFLQLAIALPAHRFAPRSPSPCTHAYVLGNLAFDRL